MVEKGGPAVVARQPGQGQIQADTDKRCRDPPDSISGIEYCNIAGKQETQDDIVRTDCY